MAFTIPTFNLIVDVWTGPPVFPPVGAPRITILGNLSPGRRIMLATSGAPPLMELLVAALTDLRGGNFPTGSDVVEVPQGSGRFYKVIAVDDVGKGFLNEHRIAWIAQQPLQPIPLP